MQILDKITQLEKEATEFGFNWTDPRQIIQQISSEIKEIEVESKRKKSGTFTRRNW